ncbi:hypothetical protein [Burkholderia ubonensis]|uniref:hypothetical protein n=1 Tax=Burkholderia ubonensis TaxID=101571 RepID=UPI000A846D80|nr:hypothetical protein [Burkholderia ubonensis]
MGFLNKISARHTLLEAVRLKESQCGISSKTKDKLRERINTEVKKINNENGNDNSLKNAFNHLNSLPNKTGAGTLMLLMLKDALCQVRSKTTFSTQHSIPSNSKLPSDDIHQARRGSTDGSAADAGSLRKSVLTEAQVAIANGASVDKAIEQYGITESAEIALLHQTGSMDSAFHAIDQGVPWDKAASDHGIDDRHLRKNLREMDLSHQTNNLDRASLAVKQGHDWKEVAQSNGIRHKPYVAKLKEISEERRQRAMQVRKDFSLVYQSNVGCRAINLAARAMFANQGTAPSLRGKEVIEEYQRSFSDNIFRNGNKDLKYKIEAWCEDLKLNVRAAADAFYTPTSSRHIVSWRGAVLTQKGLEKIQTSIKQSFAAGQFLSTSTKKEVAQSFCGIRRGDVPVLFRINGNSGNGVRVGNGLDFISASPGGEREILYSPKARFRIESVTPAHSAQYDYEIHLRELENGSARPIPT